MRRKRQTLDDEIRALDTEIARAVIECVTNPPSWDDVYIRTSRAIVKASMELGDPIRPSTMTRACRPLSSETGPWSPTPRNTQRPTATTQRRWWKRR